MSSIYTLIPPRPVAIGIRALVPITQEGSYISTSGSNRKVVLSLCLLGFGEGGGGDDVVVDGGLGGDGMGVSDGGKW
jgi:hypothetical protein